MTGDQAYALSKKYIRDSLSGAGAIRGKSAYEIAVENGYTGTETEWLASLNGKDGGGTVYMFEQETPSAHWEIAHSLGNQFPTVLCIDADGNNIFGDVTFVSEDVLTIDFSEALTGKAFIK